MASSGDCFLSWIFFDHMYVFIWRGVIPSGNAVGSKGTPVVAPWIADARERMRVAMYTVWVENELIIVVKCVHGLHAQFSLGDTIPSFYNQGMLSLLQY